MSSWQQTTTFKQKSKQVRKIKNKRRFRWRLETNARVVENVKIEFDYEACLQHEKWMEKNTIRNIGDKWQYQNLNGHITLKAPRERNNKKLMKTWKHCKTRKMGNYENMRVVKRQKGGKKNGMIEMWSQWLQMTNWKHFLEWWWVGNILPNDRMIVNF